MLDSRNIVPSCRTGTSFEIRNENLKVTITKNTDKNRSTSINLQHTKKRRNSCVIAACREA